MELQALYNNPLFLSLILLLSIAIWLKLGRRRTLNLPPSPPKLPIIGNIHQFGTLPHRSLRDLSRKYGSLFLMQLGNNRTVVVSSADMAKELVKNHDVAFSNRPQTTAASVFFYGCRDLGFAPYGKYWREVRKISALQLFNLRRINSDFQFVREEEVDVLINKIKRASLNGECVNLSKMLMVVTNNIVSRCVVSRKIEEEDGDNRFGRLIRRMMILLTSFCVGDMLPYLRWVDLLTGLIPNLKSVFVELDAILDQIIEEHRALQSHEEMTDSRKDFVSIILQLQKDGMVEMELTQDNIKAIILDMIVAGTETSSTLMEWLMAELMKHPNVMRKVQEEVRNVVGNNKSKVGVDAINKMVYLKCVIKETFRLHASALIARETSANIELGGYDIPSNTPIFINVFAIHTDPNWWEKPMEFIPERFENSTVDFKGQDFHFIPFGCGRRGCPGMPFGVASIEYVISNLLYFFDWKLPAGEIAENLDMTELNGLNVSKKIPLHVLPISQLFV